jgi:hypothetical protein
VQTAPAQQASCCESGFGPVESQVDVPTNCTQELNRGSDCGATPTALLDDWTGFLGLRRLIVSTRATRRGPCRICEPLMLCSSSCDDSSGCCCVCDMVHSSATLQMVSTLWVSTLGAHLDPKKKLGLHCTTFSLQRVDLGPTSIRHKFNLNSGQFYDAVLQCVVRT